MHTGTQTRGLTEVVVEVPREAGQRAGVCQVAMVVTWVDGWEAGQRSGAHNGHGIPGDMLIEPHMASSHQLRGQRRCSEESQSCMLNSSITSGNLNHSDKRSDFPEVIFYCHAAGAALDPGLWKRTLLCDLLVHLRGRPCQLPLHQMNLNQMKLLPLRKHMGKI